MELDLPVHSTYDFVIKTGATKPNLAAQLTDDNNNPIDLTDATVRFRMKYVGMNDLLIDDQVIVTSSTTGEIEYVWSDGDTDSPGDHLAEFAVDYSGGTGSNFEPDEFFPSDSYLDIKISPSL